jgi:hypothetical protein
MIRNYNEFLVVDPDVNKITTRTTSVKKTKYGYLVKRFNCYITESTLKIFINENKSAKIRWEVKKNYHATQNFTTYYNTTGHQITKMEYHAINKK